MDNHQTAASGPARSPIVLIGAGDTGAAVMELLSDHPSHYVFGFLDDQRTGSVHGISILGPVSYLSKLRALGVENIAITISMDVDARVRIAGQAQAHGLRCPTLIHRLSSVSPHAEIGAGTILFPFTSIGYSATIGNFSILKDHSAALYNSKIGDFCLLGPYSCVGTHSCLGNESLLYIRASIANRCRIGERCIVYPHSYVNKQAPAGSRLTGAPATSQGIKP